MYGYICGFTFGDEVNYCPYCGSDEVTEYMHGVVQCMECRRRFGVVEDDEDSEETN